jgi:hypothetical protein
MTLSSRICIFAQVSADGSDIKKWNAPLDVLDARPSTRRRVESSEELDKLFDHLLPIYHPSLPFFLQLNCLEPIVQSQRTEFVARAIPSLSSGVGS